MSLVGIVLVFFAIAIVVGVVGALTRKPNYDDTPIPGEQPEGEPDGKGT